MVYWLLCEHGNELWSSSIILKFLASFDKSSVSSQERLYYMELVQSIYTFVMEKEEEMYITILSTHISKWAEYGISLVLMCICCTRSPTVAKLIILQISLNRAVYYVP
jgi:hypothetical protein